MTPYYQDDAVTLYLGNCLEVLPHLEPVAHVLTDPPYSRDVYTRLRAPNTKKGSGTPGRMGIGNHQYSSTSIEKLAAGAIGEVNDLAKPVARLLFKRVKRWVIVFSDAEFTHQWKAYLEGAAFRYARAGAWVKPDPMPQFSGDRPAVGFEPCTICHAKGPMRWNGGGKAAVWIHNTVKGGTKGRHGHPCPKPEPLMRELVADFTDLGETVLDPFAGVGTTGVAAKRLGRRAILVELDEQYAESAARRLEATTFEPSLLPSPNVKGKQGSLLRESA